MSIGMLSHLREFKDAAYFRRRAARTRGLSQRILQPDARKVLLNLARDYEELAEDLDRGLNRIRHPELLPKRTFSMLL
jgi:hypothetical protein